MIFPKGNDGVSFKEQSEHACVINWDFGTSNGGAISFKSEADAYDFIDKLKRHGLYVFHDGGFGGYLISKNNLNASDVIITPYSEIEQDKAYYWLMSSISPERDNQGWYFFQFSGDY